MPTIDENKKTWDAYHWPKDGDEWSDQAEFCGQPYDLWKKALVEEFLLPYLHKGTHIVEIGPGHGRWMEYYAGRVARASVVDVSPSCIHFCKNKFSSYSHIKYFVNDGQSLKGISDKSVDFIWSYDVFVHVEKQELESYLKEFFRVLKPSGRAVIHHTDQKFIYRVIKKLKLNEWPKIGNAFEEIIRKQECAWRSDLSKKQVKKAMQQSGFRVIKQTNEWGNKKQYNCKIYGDKLTVFAPRLIAADELNRAQSHVS